MPATLLSRPSRVREILETRPATPLALILEVVAMMAQHAEGALRLSARLRQQSLLPQDNCQRE
jgi:hypothetical protein